MNEGFCGGLVFILILVIFFIWIYTLIYLTPFLIIPEVDISNGAVIMLKADTGYLMEYCGYSIVPESNVDDPTIKFTIVRNTSSGLIKLKNIYSGLFVGRGENEVTHTEEAEASNFIFKFIEKDKASLLSDNLTLTTGPLHCGHPSIILSENTAGIIFTVNNP
jgi:hypothetical protein